MSEISYELFIQYSFLKMNYKREIILFFNLIFFPFGLHLIRIMEFVKDDTNNDRGIMNVKVFKDKLKKVLMKRKIRRSQKISKTLLREIFDDLYKKELDIDVPLENEGEEGSKGFYEDIYDRVTKGIDPDQEIEASDIKKWISPKRISEAASEIIEYMVSPSYYDDL